MVKMPKPKKLKKTAPKQKKVNLPAAKTPMMPPMASAIMGAKPPIAGAPPWGVTSPMPTMGTKPKKK